MLRCRLDERDLAGERLEAGPHATSSSSVRKTICGSPAERPSSSSSSGFTDRSSSLERVVEQSGTPSPPAERTSASRLTSTWARSPVTSSDDLGGGGGDGAERVDLAAEAGGLLDLLAVGERPVDRDVAGELLPLGEGRPAGAGHVHEDLAVGVVGEQAVDPLELEPEVAVGAGVLEGLLLGPAARPTLARARSDASTRGERDGDEQEPGGAGRAPRPGW